MRVAFWSGFDRFTGYGNDAVDIAMGLDRLGVDVVPWCMNMTSGVPERFARLLTKDPTGSYDVVLMFAPPFDIKPERFAWMGKKAVGWSMWEKTPLIRADMDGHGWSHPYRRRTFWGEPLHEVRGKQHLDLMLVTTPMNVEAFQSLDPHVPYKVLPCGIETADWPEMVHGHPDGRMRFGMIGMLAGRKDPFVMLQAWKELKEEHPDFDAVLEMKTSCPGLHPALMEVYPDTVLHMQAWPRQKVVDWYGTIDVLVSTSRGEGNNKPAMEFMCTGGPVIATDWSGHQNWLHETWGYPLRGELVANSVGVSDFRVDKEHLKERILEAWSDKQGRLKKGRASRGVMLAQFDWSKVCGDLERVLGSLL